MLLERLVGAGHSGLGGRVGVEMGKGLVGDPRGGARLDARHVAVNVSGMMGVAAIVWGQRRWAWLTLLLPPQTPSRTERVAGRGWSG